MTLHLPLFFAGTANKYEFQLACFIGRPSKAKKDCFSLIRLEFDFTVRK